MTAHLMPRDTTSILADVATRCTDDAGTHPGDIAVAMAAAVEAAAVTLEVLRERGVVAW